MSNLLISAKVVADLFDEPAIFELYRTERTLPNTIIFLQRAVITAQNANTATLKLLGRILRAGTLAIGFLQLIRPKTNVTQVETVSALKSSCLAASNVLLTYANASKAPGNLQIQISDSALEALKRIETYDPGFTHFLPVTTAEGIKVHIEGDGVSLEQHVAGTAIINGILEDYERVVAGVAFPIEALG